MEASYCKENKNNEQAHFLIFLVGRERGGGWCCYFVGRVVGCNVTS
jgi:hypothetical protein